MANAERIGKMTETITRAVVTADSTGSSELSMLRVFFSKVAFKIYRQDITVLV